MIEARAESRDVATMEVTLHNERSNSTVFEELLVKSGLKLGQPGHPLLSKNLICYLLFK